MFELFFHGNYSGLSKSTKDSVGLQELGTARKLYPPEPEERARAGPNSKGQLASNREGQEQWHLFLFSSSIYYHCLPWAKAKQKPKNKEPVTLAPGAQREQRMILGEGRAQQTQTDFKGNKISGWIKKIPRAWAARWAMGRNVPRAPGNILDLGSIPTYYRLGKSLGFRKTPSITYKRWWWEVGESGHQLDFRLPSCSRISWSKCIQVNDCSCRE